MTPEREATPTAQPVPLGWFARMDLGALQILMLGAIAIVLVVGALDHASAIAVPTVLAVLAAIALAPLARRIESLRVPPSLAAAMIVAGLLVTSAASIYALLPSAEAWNTRAPEVLRQIENRARQISDSLSEAFAIDSAADRTADASPGAPTSAASVATTEPDASETSEESDESEEKEDDAMGQLMEGGQKLAADWAISAPLIVGGAVYWAVLTFFLLRDRAMLGRRMMGLGAGFSARRALGRAINDVQSDVARYLLAITLINCALGLCVAGAFYLLGVPNAALWGAAAGLLNFMPFVGAAIMALVTLGVGIVSFEDPLIAFAPLVVVVVLSTIEGQIVTPLILGARMRIPTIGIFVAIAFGAWLWGAVGALVATPTLIVASAFVTRLNAARMGTPKAPAENRRRRG